MPLYFYALDKFAIPSNFRSLNYAASRLIILTTCYMQNIMLDTDKALTTLKTKHPISCL